jgi:hypothetical protein
MSLLFELAFLFCAMTTLTENQNAPGFDVTLKRPDDRFKMEVEENRVLFSIHSPSGISTATIKRSMDKWPEEVVLKLHLKALENVSISNGRIKIQSSVHVEDEQLRVRSWREQNEELVLDASSPYWTRIRIFGADNKPSRSLPINNGYFELQLPKGIFTDNPQSISISWIDFYR